MHFVGIGLVTALVGGWLVALQPFLLLLVAAFVPLWGVGEYFVHRNLLHGDSVWRGLARDHGTHHVYFPADDMYLADHVDVYRVLLRPQDVVAIELFVAVAAAAVTAAFGLGLGLVVATSANLYALLYELAHAAAHLGSVANRPGVARLARHHRAHHAEISDARRNFAIVFPWVDGWFGTRVGRR